MMKPLLSRVISLLLILVATGPALAAESHADVQAVLSTTALHAGDKATVAVVVTVHKDLHAQSHTPTDAENGIAFTVTMKKQPGLTFGPVEYPAGIDITYPLLGKLNVYVGKTIIKVPITVAADAKPGDLNIAGDAMFQACNDKVCFNPEDPKFTLQTSIVPADQPVQSNADYVQATTPEATAIPPPASSSDAMFLGLDLTKNGAKLAFPAAFLIGLIFNLMPCVLPVLPLKIMGFYEVSQHNKAKSVALGAVFSAGLIASFGVLAIFVVGLKTLNWGGLFGTVWFTVAISVVLVVMAISTFGFFSVNVPNALYSFTPRHDTYVGNFLFGVLTAALSTPCTFGMFVGLLAWALKQPSSIGVAALMIVGVGMASPYMVLSAFPEVARKFPRTGPWAEVVKQMMGFLLLTTAVFFAKPLFERFVGERTMWWSMLAVMTAGCIFLVVRTIQLSKNLLPRAIGLGLAVLIFVPSLLITERLTEVPFKWTPYSDKALADAIASGKPVLIDFTASWCTNCHYIEGFVLHSPDVVHEVNSRQIVMLQADMTHQDAPARPLLDKLHPGGSVPLTAVYFPKSTTPELLDGIYTTDDLLKTLNQGK
jgi:thiol:disulfide interchange protein DsbD